MTCVPFTPALVTWYDPNAEDMMSKRKPNAHIQFDSDPARANVRDPEQKNDELERHDPPERTDPKERGVLPPVKGHSKKREVVAGVFRPDGYPDGRVG